MPPAMFDLHALKTTETLIRQRAALCDSGSADLGPDLVLLHEQGFAVAPFAEADGGQGWAHTCATSKPLFEALRMLGRANLSVGRLFEGHVNAIKLILLYGSPAQIAAAAERARAGDWFGVWGADGDPSVAFDGTTLTGTKRFASGLGLISRAVVVVNCDGPAQLVIAQCDDQSLAHPECWQMSGMRATASGEYRFDNTAGEALGAPGSYQQEPWFEGGVWRYCAIHLGGAEAIRDEVTTLLADGARSDRPQQRSRLAEIAVACETARLWILEAAQRVECQDSRKSGESSAAYALLAREMTERICISVMQHADRAIGTAAHELGSRLELLRRDLGLFLRQADPDGKFDRASEALACCQGKADCL